MHVNAYTHMEKRKRATKYIVATVVILLMIATGLGSYIYFKPKTLNSASGVDSNNTPVKGGVQQVRVTEPPKPVFIASPINGVMIEEKEFRTLAARPPLAVMIQNHTQSRPQYGLNKADVVYETLAEGGITRFMGIYWSQDADKIISVRSSRKYFVDILGDYKNPPYMHIGYASGATNVSAIDAIKKYGVRSFDINGPASFSRDRACEAKKASEHCAFTDTKILWANAQKNKWTVDVNQIEKLKYANDAQVIDAETAKNVTDFTVAFTSLNSAQYAARWRYDPADKVYKRFYTNGSNFITDGNEQVKADTIIYQKINSFAANDDKNHVVQDVIGNGTGHIMQDGKVYDISWSKSSFNSRTRYYYAGTQNEFPLNPGKQWIMLVPKTQNYVDNTPVAPTPTVIN